MSATAAQIARLRRTVNESDDTTYDDDLLAEYIERYPLVDERGEEPYTWDGSTQPPTQEPNDSWIPTYDLNAAAADIWDEKAAVVAADFNFAADGGRYDRAQVAEMFAKRARYYRSRRAIRVITPIAWPSTPDEDVFPWIGNLPEGE